MTSWKKWKGPLRKVIVLGDHQSENMLLPSSTRRGVPHVFCLKSSSNMCVPFAQQYAHLPAAAAITHRVMLPGCISKRRIRIDVLLLMLPACKHCCPVFFVTPPRITLLGGTKPHIHDIVHLLLACG